MKKYKRVTAGILSAGFTAIVTAFPIYAVQASSHLTWDGSSLLLEGRSYYISGDVTVTGERTIPESTNLIVENEGSLTVASSGSLDVSGNLRMLAGSTFSNCGTLTINSSGDFSNDGRLLSAKSSNTFVNGRLLLSENSSSSLSGYTQISSHGKADIKSDVSFIGDLKNEGRINAELGDVTLSGNGYLIEGSSLVCGKDLVIEYESEISNSGTLTLLENSKYSLSGIFRNSETGSVEDFRKVYSGNATSASELSLHTGAPIYGIDVSYAQGENINWAKVKASGVGFVIIRSSRGRLDDDYPMTADSCFYNNIRGALQNNIPVGVYHYSYAETVDECRDEARFVLSLIKGYDVTYPIMFDIEDEWYIKQGYTKKMLSDMSNAFCDEIKKAGYIPMLCSYVNFFDNRLDMDSLSDLPVWVAHYTTASAPSYDRPYQMWQHSCTGKVDGISGDVDLNWSYVDFDKYVRENHLNAH